MGKVSICIPTYNNLEQVKHLIGSINEQTYQDIEIIITDDSTNSDIEEWIGKQDSSFCCTRETHLNIKDGQHLRIKKIPRKWT